MTKDFKDYTDKQRVMFKMHGIEFFIEELHNDRKAYLKYCLGELKNVSDEKIKEMEILSLLEQLGYPMDEMGTYLYKNMIIKIINHLNGISEKQDIIDCKNLIIELKDGFSQFYLDVARNDLDIGIKTFHKYIEAALEKIDYSKADQNLLNNIFGNINEEIDYGEQAFVIGAYISGKTVPQQNETNKVVPKIKRLVNVPENQ